MKQRKLLARRNPRRLIFAALLVLCAAAIVCISYYYLFARATIGVSYDWYIDLNSGKLKKRISIFGLVLSEDVRETRFSRLVQEYGLSEKAPAEWRWTHGETVGVRRIFRCGYLGRCNIACSGLARALDVCGVKPQTRRRLVAEFLDLLKAEDCKRMEQKLRRLVAQWESSEGRDRCR